MASFSKQLSEFLETARGLSLVDADTSKALLELAQQNEAPRGVGKLATSAGILGGLGLTLGIILVFAANWQEIPEWFKLSGLFLLFLASHVGGLYLRRPNCDHPAMAETLSFIGGGLFLAGLALVTQIFHINEDPARGVLAWFFATIPLALLLRSAPLTGMAVVAALTWGHMVYYRQEAMYEIEFRTAISFETMLCLILFGLAPLLGRLKRSMGVPLDIIAGIGLAVIVYAMGFFRYVGGELVRYRRYAAYDETEPAVFGGRHLLIILVVSLAAILAASFLRSEMPRNRRLALLALLIATAAAMGFATALMLGVIHPGEAVDHFAFGRTRYDAWTTRVLLATVFAWILWFAWCLWLIFEGSTGGHSGIMALGVYGVALGVITRFIDLVGTLMETGVAFIIGGIILIATGIGAEKWRRILKKKMHREKQPS